MKTSTCKYFLALGAVGLLIACSTKKNSFVNRNYHAVTTEYNVLYNGNLALDAGLKELAATYTDNYWEILPVERMQPVMPKPAETAAPVVPAADGKDKANAEGEAKNANFERAEAKATKAIQKHSMNIGNSERNPQMDEAHLLLGKSRYYENRFIPALEAFNYILLKYPSSDKIDDAKIWREKTNIRLDNETVAIKNLNELIKNKEAVMDEQTFADANAILAEAYLKAQKQDSAVYVLRKAAQFTEDKEQRARYHFILGQLYGKLNQPDSAYVSFQRVIDMKRKSPRRYVIQAHAMQAAQFDYAKGDTLAFMEKYNTLLEDRENRPYLDVLNHQVALFYDKQNLDANAVKYYNKSLRTNSKDKYLTASNYRNIAEMNFEKARYTTAGIYYDSTLVHLDNRTREFRLIKKKRENLADVIKYEAIAQTNDSILRIVAMSESGRKAFFEEYIAKLREQEEKERLRLEIEARKQENMAASGNISDFGGPGGAIDIGSINTGRGGKEAMKSSSQEPSLSRAAVASRVMPTGGATSPGGTAGATGGKFYFYTPATVSYGKLEFKKRWGDRPLTENWRWSSEQRNKAKANDDAAGADSLATDGDKGIEERFTADYYLRQLPTDQKVLDSLAKDRNFAYYQLGSIYKEKFKEYKLAADKLEKLLVSQPEERLVLPSKYNLYKIYEIIDPARAALYKQQILSEYPESRYAEIIRNPSSDKVKSQTPDAAYESLFKKYGEGKIREVAAEVDSYIDDYTGEEIVPKFELLKVKTEARLKGIEEYKKGLNYVALNYPNSTEGKEADKLLKSDVPELEKLAFG